MEASICLECTECCLSVPSPRSWSPDDPRLYRLDAVRMESRRRDFPFLAGISHLSACDFQLSPQGIMDGFCDRKYAGAATWLQTNGDTVILSSLGFDDRVLEAGRSFACRLFVSDFSHPPLDRPVLAWRLMVGADEASGGTCTGAHTPYRTVPSGEVQLVVPAQPRACAARLKAVLREGYRLFTNT